MASAKNSNIWNPNQVFDISGKERDARAERAQMRAALRQEYLKLSSNPFRKGRGNNMIIDPRVEQSIAAKYTGFDYFRPTIKSFSFAFRWVVLPVMFFWYQAYRHRVFEAEKLGQETARNRMWKWI